MQASINAGGEGWLAPAQCSFYSTLKVRQIERGQATLPHLHLSKLELFLLTRVLIVRTLQGSEELDPVNTSAKKAGPRSPAIQV